MGLKKWNHTSLERLWNRCFRDLNVNLYANYTANKKAWMTMVLFNDWLKSFNFKMRNQKRKVFLKMDNAPSHSVPNVLNVEIHFLPPTTTSHLQPLVLSSVSRDIIVDNIHSTLSIVLTMMHPHSCHWKMPFDMPKVSSNTIVNCWVHSGLVERDRDTPQVEPQGTPQMKMNCCCHVFIVTSM
jgi:hypothetical protein